MGKLLKQARLEAGLSQRQLCDGEITRNMLSQIENGSAQPSMKTLQYLASRLNKPVSYFLQEDASPPAARAREAYRQARYTQALSLAREDTGEEGALLEVLCCLALAREALAENRRPYARQLLENAAQAGTRTVYYTPELERSRRLLLAKAAPEQLPAVVAALSDEELMLRAQASLAEGKAAQCAALLDAVGDASDPQWSILRGDACFALGQYREAMTFYRREEDACLRQLEHCCQRLADYKTAYYYACRQREAY